MLSRANYVQLPQQNFYVLTLRRRMATTHRQRMQSQQQMPGQSMPPVPNVGVAAGTGRSHQTLHTRSSPPDIGLRAFNRR